MNDDEVPEALVAAVREAVSALPGVTEEPAWTGVRWQVRKRTFAHVLYIANGWPPVYAREAGTDGPVTVLMFRADGDDLVAMRSAGAPYFAPIWRADEVGLMLDAPDAAAPDWADIASMLAASHRLRS